MRPTAKLQSALRTPLNDILGTEANVRILRVLADNGFRSYTVVPLAISGHVIGIMGIAIFKA